ITPEVNITSGPDFPPFGGETGEPAAVRLPIAGQADGLAVALTDFSGTDDIFVVRADANLNFLGFTGIQVGGPDASRPSITSFSNGSLWVSYTIHNSPTESDILARRVDNTGALVGPVIPVFDGTNVLADNSDLATLVNGNVVAVLQRQVPVPGSDNDIFF